MNDCKCNMIKECKNNHKSYLYWNVKLVKLINVNVKKKCT